VVYFSLSADTVESHSTVSSGRASSL